MKKRLNYQLLTVAGVCILATLILTAAVSYELFKDEVFQGLKNYAQLINTLNQDGKLVYDGSNHIIRVSIINADGSVAFDSDADPTEMENHLERPEVKKAMTSGEGYSVRQSETMEKNNFYYALRIEDGKILRVSEETGSFYRVLLGTFPVLFIIIIGMFGVCIFLSHVFIRAFMAPIESMAEKLETADPDEAYPEIRPFIVKIKAQHQDILKSANIRQEFTANVTHELKTPLTAISGYSELIANGMAGEQDVRRFASEIHHNANRLLSLINDIIKLSELDVINQAPNLEDVDLYEVAASCVDMLDINASKHKVSLMLEGEKCVIKANKDMMEELVYNLCDNAIRYNNPCGTVSVSVRKEGNDTILSVKDTGIGIGKEHQERIFERFYRVDKSRSKSSGGTGLGLAIVKHIVSVHNAKLTIESVPGEGTEIRVRFS